MLVGPARPVIAFNLALVREAEQRRTVRSAVLAIWSSPGDAPHTDKLGKMRHSCLDPSRTPRGIGESAVLAEADGDSSRS